MKVLQIIDFLPQTSGGARFVVNLAKKLKEKNIEVDVLLIDGKSSHFLDELEENNIRVIKISENINRFNILYSYRISKYLDKYDIIHVHIFPSSYQVAIAKILNRKSAPIIFTEHSSYNRRATNFLFRYIERFIYSKFNQIVCLSDQVLNFLDENLKLDVSKYKIIRNAVDTKKIYSSPLIDRVNLGLKNTDFVLLMSARFDQPKRQDLLIDILNYLPDNIIILFAGVGKNLEKLKQKVVKESLTNRIIFLGPRSDIFSLMKMVDVNVLASNYEGLSLAALEAMSTGKPFIASNVEGLDFVVNNTDYLFENEINSLKNLILKLYSNKEFYEDCAINSILQANKFDIDIMVDKYIDVYSESILIQDL